MHIEEMRILNILHMILNRFPQIQGITTGQGIVQPDRVILSLQPLNIFFRLSGPREAHLLLQLKPTNTFTIKKE